MLKEVLSGNILFLGCHLDDVEYGCGALISSLIRQDPTWKERIRIAILSCKNKSADGEIQLVRDLNEPVEALRELGVPGENLIIGPFYGQVFDSNRQGIREYLIKLNKEYQPSTVIYPGKKDIHQDHAALADEAFRIFRNINCLGYEIMRSNFEVTPNLYYAVSKGDIEAKARAVLAYKSQMTQSAGYYFTKEAIESNAIFRGMQSGLEYAEGYEIYRLIHRGE
jgi:LmbE family N-acetylglucosaminyl deacetylase